MGKNPPPSALNHAIQHFALGETNSAEPIRPHRTFCLQAARARTPNADSSHSLDSRNTHVIPGIEGVWQPCVDSPRAASCTNSTVAKCSTLWAAQFRSFLPFSQANDCVAKWRKWLRAGQRAIANCCAKKTWAVPSPHDPLVPLGASGRELDLSHWMNAMNTHVIHKKGGPHWRRAGVNKVILLSDCQ